MTINVTKITYQTDGKTNHQEFEAAIKKALDDFTTNYKKHHKEEKALQEELDAIQNKIEQDKEALKH